MIYNYTSLHILSLIKNKVKTVMKTSTQDLRTIKSEYNIRQSFLSLIQTKPLKDIRVNEICESALCSRNTFYMHYTDKYDLFEKISNKCIEEILNATKNTKQLKNISLDGPWECSKSIIEAIDKIRDKLLPLLYSDSSNYLQSKLKELLIAEGCERGKALAPTIKNMLPYDLYVHYLVSGVLEFVFYWITSTDISKDEAILILEKIHTNSVKTSASYLMSGNI